MTNIALDLVGQATLVLKRAGEVEGTGRSEDALAFLRDAREYRNALMLELPNGDFGFTMIRQYLFSVFAMHQWDALSRVGDADLAGIAAKALKESRYHVRHAGEWVVRLGDGTDESHARAQDALDSLWPYTGELFMSDSVEQALAADGLAVDCSTLKAAWDADVNELLAPATLRRPADAYMQRGGRSGLHTEHLGHMLAEMQVLQRTHPRAEW